MRVTLVVPCYNEAARLSAEPFAAWCEAHPEGRLLFVNDGSTDATAEVLETMPGDVLTLPRNRGKSEAVRAGMLAAMEVPCDAIAVWDCDLSAPLCEMEPMLTRLTEREEVAVVIGSRVAMLGHDIQRSPTRHYVGRFFASAASMTLGLPVYDTQCGAKLWRAGPLLATCLETSFIGPWTYDVELLARVLGQFPATAPVPIEEVPLRRWHHEDGSKVKPFDLIRALFNLARIRAMHPHLASRSAWTAH
jgi:glycosyltransferase involved in cell wall biosynthesis